MYPVKLNSKDEEYGYSSFYDKFFEICSNHKEQGRALMFAFIMYDFSHPQIIKVLADKDYWRDLDSLSGNYLTVFSFHIEEKSRTKVRPGKNDKVIHRMVDIAIEENPVNANYDLISSYFGDVDVRFPAILFFQIQGDTVIDYSLITLNEVSIEPAFQEIKLYIEKAVAILKNIAPENKGNAPEIFALVKNKMSATKDIRIVGNIVKKYGTLAAFIKAVSSFAFHMLAK